jgi:hypothetical protein
MCSLSISMQVSTSGLGIQEFVGSKSLARFCYEFLNLLHNAELAFSKPVVPNEEQTRSMLLSRVLGNITAEQFPQSDIPSSRTRHGLRGFSPLASTRKAKCAGYHGRALSFMRGQSSLVPLVT